MKLHRDLSNRSILDRSGVFLSSPRERSILLFALFLGLASLGRLLALSNGLRVVSFDDDIVLKGWHDPVVAAQNLDLDYSIGRFYAAGKFFILGWLQGGIPAVGQTIARGIALTIALVGSTWFCTVWTRRLMDSVVAAAIFLAAFPFYEGYQAFFSNPLLLVGLGAVSVSAVLSTSSSPRVRAISLILFAGALLCHEVFLIFGVMHVALALRSERRPVRHIWPRLLPWFTIAATFAVLFFALHALSRESYTGTTLSLDLPAAGKALIRYSVAILPPAELFIDRNSTAGLPLQSAAEILHSLAHPLDFVVLCLALGAGLLVYVHFIAPSAVGPPAISVSFLLIALLILPNLLPALTVKYQIWAMQRRIPYYYGIVGLPFGFCCLMGLRHALPKCPKWTATLVAIALSLIVFGTQTTNSRVAVRLFHQPVDLPPRNP